MSSTLKFNFSQTFDGLLWSMLAVPETTLLILEIRNEDKHETSFNALDYNTNTFLWKNVLFAETWWLGLTAATKEVVLLHQYLKMDNPDEKSLFAWHIYQQKILWQLPDFSFGFIRDNTVVGSLLKSKDEMVLASADIMSGALNENVDSEIMPSENIMTLKPFQYAEGTEHFETVKLFIANTLKEDAIGSIEYVEHNELIFISYNTNKEDLANYLLVITSEGRQVLHEKLDEHLKGLGLETFFILGGCLFFVRKKTELISYRIV